jgi:hypothetical protein
VVLQNKKVEEFFEVECGDDAREEWRVEVGYGVKQKELFAE